jgi:hypothetical protein
MHSRQEIVKANPAVLRGRTSKASVGGRVVACLHRM